MLELTDIHPDLQVQEVEYSRLLGYPAGHVLEGRARELADWARDWYGAHGRPWIYARQADGLELVQQRLRLENEELTSRSLHDQLAAARAHGAMLVAVSAGPECEEHARRLWEEGKPDEYFFLEMYGSAVVEHLITATGGRLCAWAEGQGMMVLPHYSPGYPGWEIAEQTRLWQLIRHRGAERLPGRMEVLDTGMLRPKKSLLAVFGLTRHLDQVRHLRHLVPCENCSLAGCQYRRAPYRHSRPQIEDVQRLQSRDGEDSKSKIIQFSVLNHQASYSVNPRALRKWSEERLQLKSLPDGSIEARFRYEGTTCSNLGRSLEYDYHLRLSSAGDEYRIVHAACVPAPGDTGHAAQCEYLNNPDVFMDDVASDQPLFGRPINDVLNWKRQFDPSGCYCSPAGRAHKWGLALEVVHYALVQLEKESGNGSFTTDFWDNSSRAL